MALTCVYSGGWGDLGCSAGWPFQGHWSSPECHQFRNEIPAGFDNTSFHVPADFHSKSQITQCFFMYSLFIRNFTHEHQIKVCLFSKTCSSWSTFTIQKTFYIQANNSTFCYIYINTRNLKGLRVDFQEIVLQTWPCAFLIINKCIPTLTVPHLLCFTLEWLHITLI